MAASGASSRFARATEEGNQRLPRVMLKIESLHAAAVLILGTVLTLSFWLVDERKPNVVSSTTTIEALILETRQIAKEEVRWLVDPWFWASFRIAYDQSPLIQEELRARDFVMGSQVLASDLGFQDDIGRTMRCSDSEAWVGVLNSSAEDIPSSLQLIATLAERQGCSVVMLKEADLATWVIVHK